MTCHPNAAWVEQQARNLTMHLDDVPEKATILLRDQDTKFKDTFDEIFSSDGIQVKMLPFRSPNLNAFAERVISRSSTSAWTNSWFSARGTWSISFGNTSGITTLCARTRGLGTIELESSQWRRRRVHQDCGKYVVIPGWAGCCGTTTARRRESRNEITAYSLQPFRPTGFCARRKANNVRCGIIREILIKGPTAWRFLESGRRFLSPCLQIPRRGESRLDRNLCRCRISSNRP